MTFPRNEVTRSRPITTWCPHHEFLISVEELHRFLTGAPVMCRVCNDETYFRNGPEGTRLYHDEMIWAVCKAYTEQIRVLHAIHEISYGGHPDGQADRLELINRYVRRTLGVQP